ncbi:ClpXP protease specificity-enhancing factor [Aliidiomarina sp.]|uniref:ClpXP protease specificity-enhancing factor n=1 Tax=Aliidiomarina sp. TaxID=1872439 RepID=UPI0025C5DCD4|nr:ClpXP protease specificity-enhancing factor [Aliidiomarina sp.]
MLSPRRPYLLRALYDWLLDNNLTPHVVVDATWPLVNVPQQFVKDGQIVLNVAPSAVQAFYMDNEGVRFRARFSGQEQRIELPIGSILAIYARENGAGSIFEAEDGLMPGAATAPAGVESAQPSLVAVSDDENNKEPDASAKGDAVAEENPDNNEKADANKPVQIDPPVRGRPKLRVIQDD